ncbi:hypothetical protein CMO90_02615 [Candidatus Woesearchaeota archaeon]|jgi:hypothetical protein|nr:hypothetical protein [Candidatus Woesearchaeota archaeon]|tara:strand:+ start:305 stop:523 length:219 start_codon:yes stop_codon:yes gene_type:complete
MSAEISKNTIVILVVLTVALSFLGTWTVVNEVNKLESNSDNYIDAPATSGKATITILERKRSSGQATIEILD